MPSQRENKMESKDGRELARLERRERLSRNCARSANYAADRLYEEAEEHLTAGQKWEREAEQLAEERTALSLVRSQIQPGQGRRVKRRKTAWRRESGQDLLREACDQEIIRQEIRKKELLAMFKKDCGGELPNYSGKLTLAMLERWSESGSFEPLPSVNGFSEPCPIDGLPNCHSYKHDCFDAPTVIMQRCLVCDKIYFTRAALQGHYRVGFT